MKDINGVEITEGCYVLLLDVQPHWFEYEPVGEAKKLHEACKKPVRVSDICDDHVTVDLPSTIANDGDIVANSISTVPRKVKVVEHQNGNNT